MSRKHKKVCWAANYIEHFLALAPAITECISITDLAFLLGVPIGITSSSIGLKICAIATGILKKMSVLRKRKGSMIRQFGFTYSAYGPFANKKEKVRKVKETTNSRYIYQNQLDKACFQHDLAYGRFKDLTRTTTCDRILYNKVLNIAKYPKYDEYQLGLASMV